VLERNCNIQYCEKHPLGRYFITHLDNGIVTWTPIGKTLAESREFIRQIGMIHKVFPQHSLEKLCSEQKRFYPK
jgi:hypothetical protein